MQQAIIWTNGDSIHSRIYAALGGDELMPATPYMYYIISFMWRYIHSGVSMVAVDVLVPIGCQDIYNHCDDLGQ